MLAQAEDGVQLRVDGACGQSQPLHPDLDLLAVNSPVILPVGLRHASDLDLPQLIVMRPSGGKGAGLAILRDNEQFAMAVHEARKLGAVVNLWAITEKAGRMIAAPKFNFSMNSKRDYKLPG